ncbi:MAG TPA: hypothetical protein VFR78_17195 [Pyrinomonadaceae bacterium]|nr:hypothetical protein [Pyrinomonadaceae bacterium]
MSATSHRITWQSWARKWGDWTTWLNRPRVAQRNANGLASPSVPVTTEMKSLESDRQTTSPAGYGVDRLAPQ